MEKGEKKEEEFRRNRVRNSFKDKSMAIYVLAVAMSSLRLSFDEKGFGASHFHIITAATWNKVRDGVEWRQTPSLDHVSLTMKWHKWERNSRMRWKLFRGFAFRFCEQRMSEANLEPLFSFFCVPSADCDDGEWVWTVREAFFFSAERICVATARKAALTLNIFALLFGKQQTATPIDSQIFSLFFSSAGMNRT